MTILLDRAEDLVASPAQAAPKEGARIGPNAVIQLEAALVEAGGAALAERIFSAAGLMHYLGAALEEMIDEAVPRALFDALFGVLPRDEALAIARRAGGLTGEYILAHRIPAPARLMLRLLPAPIAGPLLLKAISRHAWTFAGSGRCGISTKGGLEMIIAGNPLAMPQCAWHVAVLETLFQTLASPRARARHDGPCAAAHEACRFRIEFLAKEAAHS